MKKNASIIGIIIGIAMLILHFFPWATTETKIGTAFSEGMYLVLTIPNYVTVILATLYFIIFLLIQIKKIKNINISKISSAVLSILIAASAIVNILTMPDNFGTVIIGEGYSFGFGEIVSGGFGLYLLAVAAIFGIIISLICSKNAIADSVNN
jgi:hypothetical protein